MRIVLALLLYIVLISLTAHAAFGRDLGQWETTDPEVRTWYQALMQPALHNNTRLTCLFCAEA